MRPCGHATKLKTGETYDINTMCRVCWLFHNDPRYFEKWKDPGDSFLNYDSEEVKADAETKRRSCCGDSHLRNTRS